MAAGMAAAAAQSISSEIAITHEAKRSYLGNQTLEEV
jgi:hypothetical protein